MFVQIAALDLQLKLAGFDKWTNTWRQDLQYHKWKPWKRPPGFISQLRQWKGQPNPSSLWPAIRATSTWGEVELGFEDALNDDLFLLPLLHWCALISSGSDLFRGITAHCLVLPELAFAKLSHHALKLHHPGLMSFFTPCLWTCSATGQKKKNETERPDDVLFLNKGSWLYSKNIYIF